MLRRYSSRGLDGVAIRSKTTIGTARHCDIKLNATGVSPLHATIEFHPLTRSYWLRDHSLTATTINGHHVNGQVELTDGDLVRFGDAQPLVFQNDSLVYMTYANGIDKRRDSGEFLPVLGKRIVPQSANTRAVSAKFNKHRRSRSESADAGYGRVKRNTEGSPSQSDPLPSSIHNPMTKSATATILRAPSAKNRSVGNELLQRVVKLQGEVARRDEEMRVLRGSSSRSEMKRGIEGELIRARRDNEKLREMLMSQGRLRMAPLSFSINDDSSSSPSTPDIAMEHAVYRSFLATTASELRKFNEKTLNAKSRDYSEIFNIFTREMNDPFAIKMLEVESGCELQLSKLGFEKVLGTVRELFRDDRMEIAALSTQIDQLWPIVRDSMAIARDSVRACAAFATWSRKLGDHIRATGLNSDRLLTACDELKSDFVESRLAGHWLPPSLSPLLRTAAVEMRKNEKGEVDERRERRRSSTNEKRIRKRSTPQEEVNLEVLAEIQSALDEEKKKTELLLFEKNEMQTSFDTKVAQFEEEKLKMQKELNNEKSEKEEIKTQSEQNKTQFELKIKELEEELKRILQEKALLEAEIDDEAQKIHANVTQSVEKLRSKRSASQSSNDSLSAPSVPPLFSLTDPENIEIDLKMDESSRPSPVNENEETEEDHAETSEKVMEEQSEEVAEEEKDMEERTEDAQEQSIIMNESNKSEMQELENLMAQTNRLHELREKAQDKLAPGSIFQRVQHQSPDERDVAQKIYDVNTEFRRTANFIRGLIGVLPLEENVPGSSPKIENDERERILYETEELVGGIGKEKVDHLEEEEKGEEGGKEEKTVEEEKEVEEKEDIKEHSDEDAVMVEETVVGDSGGQTVEAQASVDSRMSGEISAIGSENGHHKDSFDGIQPREKIEDEETRSSDSQQEEENERAHEHDDMEERRMITQQLNRTLLEKEAPKSVSDVAYSSHIQSHINSASRPSSAVRNTQPLPMKVVHFQPPMPSVTEKHLPITSKSSLVQPRFRF